MTHPGWSGGADELASHPRPHENHIIVVGGNALALRLAAELAERYQLPVIAILRDPSRDQAPQIAELLGEDAVVVAAVVGKTALQAANIAHARGIAVVEGDDQDKLRVALLAQSLGADIRIVLDIDDGYLGAAVEQLASGCTTLSSSAAAASVFVNAALRRPDSVLVGGRSVALVQGAEIEPGDFLGTVADSIDASDPHRTRLLPDAAGPAWLGSTGQAEVLGTGTRAVLQFARETPEATQSRIQPWGHRLIAMWRVLTGTRTRVLTGAAVAIALAGFLVIVSSGRPVSWAAYDALFDVSHLATPDYYAAPTGTGGAWQRVAQVALAMDGLLMAALVTAWLVSKSVRRQQDATLPVARVRGHVVVIGLGAVGTRIAAGLRESGVPVVCIEREPTAADLTQMRDLDIPVLAGAEPLLTQLRRARVEASRAVVAVADDDAANLEALMQVRVLAPEVRVVQQLLDHDIAARVQNTFGNTVARSAAYLAAPQFAAALMGVEVLGTLSVAGQALFIAQYTVEENSPLIGEMLREIEVSGGRRVVAVKPAEVTEYVWRPDPGRRLALRDRYVVIATRSGLALGNDYSAGERHGLDGVETAVADLPTQQSPSATGEIEIAVYLSDEAQGETVRSAVMTYLRAVGAEITEDGEPIIGSWSWLAKARRVGKAAAQSQTAHNAGTLAESAAWGPVRSRQADINLVNSQAVANLVQSLAGSPSGLILIGSLLVVKNGGVPIVVMLSQEQVNALERRPALLSQPESILDDLQRIRAESAYVYDEDPPTLTA